MFLVANLFGACMLFMEAQLAWYAFSGYDVSCEDAIPCAVDPKGFNLNFAAIPVMGKFV